MKTKQFEVTFGNINLLKFENEIRGLLHSRGCNVWFSDGAVDLIARMTVNNPFVNLKEGSVVFRYQLEDYHPVPFMTYVPTTGVDESQIFCLSEKKKTEQVKKYLGNFFSLFVEHYGDEDIFPKDVVYMVSPYMRRFSDSDITTICLYHETDDNTWNFFEKGHCLEFESGSIFFSSTPCIPSSRREKLSEWILRKTIHRRKFS